MQAIRERVVELEYLEGTGRPVDLDHLNFLRGLLEADVNEFKGKPKADRSINFNGSWSGKPVSQLVNESKNAMRVQQYESLYRDGLRGPCSTEVDARRAVSITRRNARRLSVAMRKSPLVARSRSPLVAR